MLVAPLSQLFLYLWMWFSSIKVSSCQLGFPSVFERLKFTVLEDTEWPQNKCNESLTKFSIAGGPGRSIWQGATCLAALLSSDCGLLQNKGRQVLCSQPPAVLPTSLQQSEPLQTLLELGHLWAACCWHAPYLTNSLHKPTLVNLCVWETEEQWAGLCQQVQSLCSCCGLNLTILRYSIMCVFREVIFDFWFPCQDFFSQHVLFIQEQNDRNGP